MRRAVPPVMLLALTLAVYWKIALTNQYTWLNSPDHVNQILPWMEEEARQLRQGKLALWDMHHWSGQSLIGQDQPGVLFPLNWLLWAMPLDHGHISLFAANWYFVLIHYFAALFAYLLARDLGLSAFASVCVGVSFGLSGFMGNVDWPQMLNGGMFAPLVFLYALRALGGKRPVFSMAVAGTVEGFSMWSGHHQLPTFTLLGVAFLLIFYVVLRGLRVREAVLLGGICVAFTMLAGAPQLLPSYEYWSRGLRWVGSQNPVGWHDKVPYIVFNLFSFNPVSLINFVLPAWQPIGTPFVGVAILALAMIAVAWGGSDRRVGPFVGLGVAGLIFSLGSHSVFHGALYSALPLIDKSRNAGFAVFLVDLALAVLAGLGIDFLLTRKEEIRATLRKTGVILVGCGAAIFALVAARAIFQGDKVIDYPAFAMLALSSVALGVVLMAWRSGRLPAIALQVAILAIVLYDIGNVTGQHFPHREQNWRYVDQLSSHDDLAGFLRSRPGLFRIDKNSDDISYNFGDWYGVDEYEGYAGITENIFGVAFAPHVHEMVGVAYDLAKARRNTDADEVFHGRAGVNIYRVPDPFPRAWTVHTARKVAAQQDRGAHFDVPREQLESSTFVTAEPPQLTTCGARDSLAVQELNATEFRIEANMACRGMVILANTFFPGWRAEVDGQTARVWEAYTFLTGVVVDAGAHHVRMFYRPDSFYWGCALAGAAALGLLFLSRLREPLSAYPDL